MIDRRLASVFLILLCVSPARAQTTLPTSRPFRENAVSTDHAITLDGQVLHYTATAGTMAIKDDAGKERAQIFYIAYEKMAPSTRPATQPTDPAKRPVTFIFNGGPGSASVWLHLGTAGPKRIKLGEGGSPASPPYSLTDNAQSWLDLTDLVFIDPVGTGYSRAVDAEKAKEFYGVKGDVESVGEFIRLFNTQYHRWPSPKFLAGESYGTTRAAALSKYLHGRLGCDLNGIVLIGTVLNFQTIAIDRGNDTPFPLYVPTYTAIAHYHHKLSPELQADFSNTIAQARQWAQTDYTTALSRGASLDDATRQAVTKKLAAYTGLPESYVSRSDLKIEPWHFEKMLLADERKVIGRFDGRITGFDATPLEDGPDSDPSLDGYLGTFSSTINGYLRSELKYESDAAYEVLSPRVQPWDFGKANDGYLNVSTSLRESLTANPHLKLLVCCGYYDLATPFAAADYTVNAMPLSKELRSNIKQSYYEGGHMFYTNPAALAQLKTDLREFYHAAIPN